MANRSPDSYRPLEGILAPRHGRMFAGGSVADFGRPPRPGDKVLVRASETVNFLLEVHATDSRNISAELIEMFHAPSSTYNGYEQGDLVQFELGFVAATLRAD